MVRELEAAASTKITILHLLPLQMMEEATCHQEVEKCRNPQEDKVTEEECKRPPTIGKPHVTEWLEQRENSLQLLTR